ncbi:hypothetical protein F4679DRAFT_582903 [Xylaria curta]|nr:hypothetical protein F4679DRAFT_582903 [Xylaria curta]
MARRIIFTSCDEDTSHQITLKLQLSSASGSVLFKLRIPVEIKGCENTKRPLYLRISGDRISSLVHDVPDTAPEVAKTKLGTALGRLILSLTSSPDVVVPSVPLVPRNKIHAHDTLPEALVNSLCNAATNRTLKAIDPASPPVPPITELDELFSEFYTADDVNEHIHLQIESFMEEKIDDYVSGGRIELTDSIEDYEK